MPKPSWFLLPTIVVAQRREVVTFNPWQSVKMNIQLYTFFTKFPALHQRMDCIKEEKSVFLMESWPGYIFIFRYGLTPFLFIADTFFSGHFDSGTRGTTFLPSFCHFAGQISYPFDFISWRNLLVEFYGNGRPWTQYFVKQYRKIKVRDLRNITSNTLSTSPANT